jgi:hypothetical protein
MFPCSCLFPAAFTALLKIQRRINGSRYLIKITI